MKTDTIKYEIASDGFTSSGDRCDALFYYPAGERNELRPAVIMAHGLGAEMSFKLHSFADRFAQEGIAVFMFDYRGFGKSEGAPRQLINPFRHLQDWRAALEYVKGKNEIDPDRIALWGTSFSAGHALSLAARHPEIKGVSAQVPFLDGPPSVLQLGALEIMKLSWAGVRDILRTATGRPPSHIPIVGKPGKTALMNKPDCWSGYLSLAPDNSGWENRCPARIALTLPFYRPISKFSKINCPCLLVNAEKDSLFSPKTIRKGAKKIANCEVIDLDCGHFGPYAGTLFEKAVNAQTRFFKNIFFD